VGFVQFPKTLPAQMTKSVGFVFRNPDDLDQYALAATAVKLAKKNLLPGTKVVCPR
jgi:hypothetical protein